jgi:hypothetical protein
MVEQPFEELFWFGHELELAQAELATRIVNMAKTSTRNPKPVFLRDISCRFII